MSSTSEVGIRCLHCGQVNLEPNRDSIDNWNCHYCHSGFLSLTMLANLASRQLVNQLSGRGRRDMRAPRDCPRCARAMAVIPVHFNAKDLVLDVCRKCRLTWFDSGELLRTLRHRAPENEVHDEHGVVNESPLRRYQAPASPAPRARALEKTYVPIATPQIAILCAALMPLVARHPEWRERFGFSPLAPFREHGLTALTGMFLFDGVGSLLGCLVVLLFTGHFVERRVGEQRLLRVLLLGGLTGNAFYALSATVRDPMSLGLGFALTTLVCYAAVSFPLMRFLFPVERHRSPASLVAKIAVLLVSVCSFCVCWEFFATALTNYNQGLEGIDYTGSHFAALGEWLKSASCKGHVTAAGLGLVWGLAEQAGRFAAGERAQEAPTKRRPLPPVRLRG